MFKALYNLIDTWQIEKYKISNIILLNDEVSHLPIIICFSECCRKPKVYKRNAESTQFCLILLLS